jgi:glycosyltransferase involved in cell wall biosynthesis
MLDAIPLAPVAVIGNPKYPPDHWRIVRPYIRLRQAGMNAQYIHGADQNAPVSPDNTLLVLPHLTGQDTESLAEWLAERRPMVRKIVYETDDDIFTEDRLQHLQDAEFMQGKTVAQIRAEQDVARWLLDQVDAVTVSTEPLAALVRSFTRMAVFTVPNALDVRWFRAHMYYRRPWEGAVTIGWAGGRRSERDIVSMARAWGKIAKRYPKVMFVTAAPTTLQAVYRYVPESRVIRLGWLNLDEYPLAYQVDIGCCSVRDTAFNRCRSPIKAWEYAIAGAAVVATPTLYGETIEDGVTGLLAESADECEEALVRLIEDERARRRMMLALAARVEREHNLDTQLHVWTDTYKEIALGGRHATQEGLQPQVSVVEHPDRDEARQGPEAGGGHRVERSSEGAPLKEALA